MLDDTQGRAVSGSGVLREGEANDYTRQFDYGPATLQPVCITEVLISQSASVGVVSSFQSHQKDHDGGEYSKGQSAW